MSYATDLQDILELRTAMKLTRFYDQGKCRQGVVIDDATVLDATEFGEDWNEEFFAADGLHRLAGWVESSGSNARRLSFANLELAPSIARPSKIICIGLNYADHAKEDGRRTPYGAGHIHEVDHSMVRTERPTYHSERIGEDRLGSGVGRRHRQEGPACFGIGGG